MGETGTDTGARKNRCVGTEGEGGRTGSMKVGGSQDAELRHSAYLLNTPPACVLLSISAAPGGGQRCDWEISEHRHRSACVPQKDVLKS